MEHKVRHGNVERNVTIACDLSSQFEQFRYFALRPDKKAFRASSSLLYAASLVADKDRVLHRLDAP